MIFRLLLLVLLLCAPLSVRADMTVQTIVHMLDYMSVDYPEFVKDGKVLDAEEYKEQQEFSTQVVELLEKLPAVPQREMLLKQARELKARVDSKALGADVSGFASDLRWKLIAAYGIAVAPRSVPDVARGTALFIAHCATCHGIEGRGDGVAGRGLRPAPSNFHDRDRMMQRSLYGLYSTITLGVAGTAMSAYAQLSEEERWALAFYAGTLGTDAGKGETLWAMGRGKVEIGTLRAVATLSDREVSEKHGAEIAQVFAWLKANPKVLEAGKESPIAFSRRLLAESVAAYRSGKREEAQQLALTSYLEGFELVEASLDTVDRNLRQEVETQMIAYRDLLRRDAPLEQIAQRAERMDGLLAASAEKLGAEGLSPTTAAVSAFFILVREGLEALLVVMAIVAFLIKANRREALVWVHAGWLGALALGVVTWFVAAKLITISGATRELTEGVTALFAAAILLYVGFWLHAKSHAQAWQAFIEQHLGSALQGSKVWALAGVSFLAVYREAFETVLFYQALWQQAGDVAHGSVVTGFLCGVATLAVLAWLILRYGLRLPIGPFFGACSALMALLAIVFTGHGIKALQEAGFIAASPVEAFNFPALGIYATAQTLLAQLVAIAIVAGAFAYTRAASKRGAKTT